MSTLKQWLTVILLVRSRAPMLLSVAMNVSLIFRTLVDSRSRLETLQIASTSGYSRTCIGFPGRLRPTWDAWEVLLIDARRFTCVVGEIVLQPSRPDTDACTNPCQKRWMQKTSRELMRGVVMIMGSNSYVDDLELR